MTEPIFNDQLIPMVEYFEGLSLLPYKDKGDVPTIGYGHTGREVNAWYAEIGFRGISELEANTLLTHDLENARIALYHNLPSYDALTNNQLSALTSFVFNLGIGAIDPVDSPVMSHLLDAALLLSSKDSQSIGWQLVASHMETFDHLGRVVLEGLQRRRKAEALMLLGRDWTEAKDWVPVTN
jgi:lysozyme